MIIQNKIKEDMVNAMKTKDNSSLNLLRVIIGEFNRIDKEISNEIAIKIIRKMYKNALESKNSFEIIVLEKYLPKMYNENEIRALVGNIIEGNDFKTMKDMGDVMKIIKNNPDSMLIDNKLASRITKELLI